MNSNLLAWFRANARGLPWRGDPRDPYHVVVSEFMLQQTQVDRVIPRFEAFVAEFPGFEELASAREDDVLSMWSGLGYYRRARMLHELARVVASGKGRLPETAEELRRLPGIGPYTAGAVASLAFGESVPVLDGNVLRVGARVLALETDPRSAAGRRRLEAWVASLLEGGPPGEINEALMELGATVCTPSAPNCPECPLAPSCRARETGSQESYPPPRQRRATVELRWVAACCIDGEGRWLVRRIADGPILEGLWLPPIADLSGGDDPEVVARGMLPGAGPGPGRVGSVVRHSITHRRIEVLSVRFDSTRFDPPGDGWMWVDPREPGVPTSSLLAKLEDALS